MNASFKNTFDSTFKVTTKIKNEPFLFKGDLNYKDKWTLDILNNKFGAHSKLTIIDDTITIDSSNIDISSFLEFLDQEPYIYGKASLKAKGDFNKINFDIVSKNSVTNEKTIGFEQNFDLQSSGVFDINKQAVTSKYTLQAPLNKIKIKATGKIEYMEKLQVSAVSKNFDGHTTLHIEDKQIKINSSKINIQKLLKAINIPQNIYGNLNTYADGTIDNLNIKLSSKNFETKLYHQKATIICSINYKPDLITIKPYINNNNLKIFSGITTYEPKTKILKVKHNIKASYKKEKLLLKFNAKTRLMPPYNIAGSLTHNDDKIVVESFSYSDGDIKSDFNISIKELKYYKALTKKEFFGPVNIVGKYSDKLNVTSQSLGGETRLIFDDNKITVQLDSLKLSKIKYLIGEKTFIDKGLVNGKINYDLNKKIGDSDINIKNIVLNGIDLNKKLSTINDALGLNVVDLTKRYVKDFRKSDEQTKIKHLQLNLALKDETAKLNDVAFSTSDFRIVALGDIKDDGKIKELELSIVDEQGCAVMSQSLAGDIEDPKVKETTTAIVSIVQSVPSSLWGTGVKILDYATDAIDSTTEYAMDKTHISSLTDKKINLTSNIKSSASFLRKNTSDIVMPNNCKVIYNGKVKNP